MALEEKAVAAITALKTHFDQVEPVEDFISTTSVDEWFLTGIKGLVRFTSGKAYKFDLRLSVDENGNITILETEEGQWL